MSKIVRALIIITIAVVLLALVLLLPFFGRRLTSLAAESKNNFLITSDPNATSTPTAFPPLAATQTYFPTDYPTSTPTLTPKPDRIVPASSTEGVDPIPQPDGQVNIVLLGSDLLPYGDSYRTDVVILVTINTQDQTVNVTSFPRDLYITIPGWTNQRINTAFPHGGFKTLQRTFLHNFGFQPDYFVLINLWSFEYIVNDLGGITMNVPRTLCDNKWGHGQSHCVYPGPHHFYGREALWYVRSRETTNDFARNVRQQQALEALLDRFFELGTLTKIPSLYQTYRDNVRTNLDLSTVVSLIPTATKLSDRSRIQQYFINESAVTHWVSPGGGQVLLPNYGRIRNILSKALNSP